MVEPTLKLLRGEPLTNINGYLEAMRTGIIDGNRELFESLHKEIIDQHKGAAGLSIEGDIHTFWFKLPFE